MEAVEGVDHMPRTQLFQQGVLRPGILGPPVIHTGHIDEADFPCTLVVSVRGGSVATNLGHCVRELASPLLETRPVQSTVVGSNGHICVLKFDPSSGLECVVGLLEQPFPICKGAVEHSPMDEVKLLRPIPRRFEVVDLELQIGRYQGWLHCAEVGSNHVCPRVLVRKLNGPEASASSEIDCATKIQRLLSAIDSAITHEHFPPYPCR
jgi:hypothetical protein